VREREREREREKKMEDNFSLSLCFLSAINRRALKNR
jgi:hypothetical protein